MTDFIERGMFMKLEVTAMRRDEKEILVVVHY